MRDFAKRFHTPLLLANLVCGSAFADCTESEEVLADNQLLAIQENANGERDRITLEHLPHGLPTSFHIREGGPSNERTFFQQGYVLHYDDDLRTALWVAYKLTEENLEEGRNNARDECFRTDIRLPEHAAGIAADYDEPIFDQGHMANDADFKHDLIQQHNTYTYANMSPQYCRFNRGIWLSLEHLGRGLTQKYQEVYIMSGAVFDYNSRDRRDRDRSVARMGSRNQNARVGIPSDYYKIFLRKEIEIIDDEEVERWKSIAFLLEHNNEANGSSWSNAREFLLDSIVDISEIEQITDLLIFPNLARSDLSQNRIRQWDLSAGDSNLEGGCR